MDFKRVSVFSGHYGSGKTNIAVNYALNLKKLGKKVIIYDLDIVNPYFRTVDAENRLKRAGVELIVSPYAETNVDIPAMNAASYKMLDKSAYAVIDLGGDDRGALALGRFADGIKEENDYDMFLVVNPFRPETRDYKGLSEIKNEIELTGKIPFTGIVNNANLGKETTEETVKAGDKFCKEFSGIAGIPVKFTCIAESLYEKIKNGYENALKIDLIDYGTF